MRSYVVEKGYLYRTKNTISMIRFTRNILLATLCLLCSITLAQAQISFGGVPAITAQSHRVVEIIPPFNAQDLRSAEQWHQVDNGSPLIVGRMLPLSGDFYQQATHEVVQGRSVYHLELTAPDAQGLSLSFDKLALRPGDRLYLFDPARKQVLGAFTSESNPDGGVFGTNPIAGNSLVIQYEPAGALADIQLKQLGYFFESVAAPYNILGEGASGVCNVNVNCPEGVDMQDVKNGVVQILVVIEGNIGLCSGTLVNNTNQDWRPLIMTAQHCTFGKNPDTGELMNATEKDFRQWVFNFHYERPGCANNQWVGEQAYSISGAKRLAQVPMDHGSDALLVETLTPIPDYYGVYYNGWDRSGTLEPTAKGLHHPSGDVMKISTITEPLKNTRWMTDDNLGAENAHFGVRYAKTENGHCVTEGGSSGSGLFNSKGLLIGTLSGGGAECDKGINALNMYGKLCEHWARSKQDDKLKLQPLAQILDPKGHGTAMTLSGAYKPGAMLLAPVTKLQGVYQNGQVALSWQPMTALPEGITAEVQILRNGKELQRLPISTGHYTDSQVGDESGIVTYTLRYQYTIGLEDTRHYTAPRHISFFTSDLAGVSQFEEKKAGSQVTLTWRKPVNRQLISQLTLSSEGEAQAVAPLMFSDLNPDYNEVYLGVRYDGHDFAPLGQTRLAAMHFIPARAPGMHTYTLFVRNGQNIHVITSLADLDCYEVLDDDATTTINYPVGDKFTQKKWLWVKGFTPKVIRPEEMLVVGYRLQTRTYFDKDVAMIDPTPATEWSDRHNVLSFDTHYWMPADIQGALPINGGALAIEFMIDDAEPGAPVDVTGPIARGFHPAQWPVVKEYIIYADGTEIGRTQSLSYTVPNATGKKYSVKPLYENGLISATSPVLTASDAVRVYPTICTDHLTIQTNGVTGSYQLYTLDGTRLSEGALADRTIDTSSWAVGSYLLQVTLADGTTTLHRIVKR